MDYPETRWKSGFQDFLIIIFIEKNSGGFLDNLSLTDPTVIFGKSKMNFLLNIVPLSCGRFFPYKYSSFAISETDRSSTLDSILEPISISLAFCAAEGAANLQCKFELSISIILLD
jgi:hypothetical protein